MEDLTFNFQILLNNELHICIIHVETKMAANINFWDRNLFNSDFYFSKVFKTYLFLVFPSKQKKTNGLKKSMFRWGFYFKIEVIAL